MHAVAESSLRRTPARAVGPSAPSRDSELTREGIRPRLSLLKRAGRVIFLDDDPRFLESLASTVPAQWACRFFSHPDQVLDVLEAEAPFVQADLWQHQSMVKRCMAGDPLVPQLLQYWATQTERFALTQAVFVDEQLPGMSGLELLARLREFEGQRILLTGTVDERSALNAFNSGRIDYYLPKSHEDLPWELRQCLTSMARFPTEKAETAWALCLALRASEEQQDLLSREGVVLQDLLSARFSEYAVIGEPFGAVGITPDGRLEWLQFAPGGEAATVMSNSVLMQQLDCASDASTAPVQRITKGLGLASFDLTAVRHKLPAITHFGDWLACQPRRHVAGAGGQFEGGKC
jgi:CheY-like chemotaxis protein